MRPVLFTDRCPAFRLVPGTWQVLKKHLWNKWIQGCCPCPLTHPSLSLPWGNVVPLPTTRARKVLGAARARLLPPPTPLYPIEPRLTMARLRHDCMQSGDLQCFQAPLPILSRRSEASLCLFTGLWSATSSTSGIYLGILRRLLIGSWGAALRALSVTGMVGGGSTTSHGPVNGVWGTKGVGRIPKKQELATLEPA